jgi:hypothetical protein
MSFSLDEISFGHHGRNVKGYFQKKTKKSDMATEKAYFIWHGDRDPHCPATPRP